MSENNKTIPTAITFRIHKDMGAGAATRFADVADSDERVFFLRVFPVCLEAGIEYSDKKNKLQAAQNRLKILCRTVTCISRNID